MKLSIIFVLLLVSTSIAFPDAGAEELSYTDSTEVSYLYTKDLEGLKTVSTWPDTATGVCDPEHWKMQSPINVVYDELTHWELGSSHYADDFGGFFTNGELASDNGVMVAYFDNTISLGMVFQENAISATFQNALGVAQTYDVSRVIFHSPAEHTFDGQQADVEMQMVMYDQSKAAGFYMVDEGEVDDSYSLFLNCMGEANSDADASQDDVDAAELKCQDTDYRGTAMVSFFFDDDENMISDTTYDQKTGFLDTYVKQFKRLIVPEPEEFAQIFGFGDDEENKDESKGLFADALDTDLSLPFVGNGTDATQDSGEEVVAEVEDTCKAECSKDEEEGWCYDNCDACKNDWESTDCDQDVCKDLCTGCIECHYKLDQEDQQGSQDSSGEEGTDASGEETGSDASGEETGTDASGEETGTDASGEQQADASGEQQADASGEEGNDASQDSGEGDQAAKSLNKVFGPNTHKAKGSLFNKAMDEEVARDLCGDDEDNFECGRLDFSEFFNSLDFSNDVVFYQGSNTIPNCIQNVNWYLFTEVHPASTNTVDYFLSQWSDVTFNNNYDQDYDFGRAGNNRPVQETNDRTVWAGSASYWTDLVVPYNNDGSINWKQASDKLKTKLGHEELEEFYS